MVSISNTQNNVQASVVPNPTKTSSTSFKNYLNKFVAIFKPSTKNIPKEIVVDETVKKTTAIATPVTVAVHVEPKIVADPQVVKDYLARLQNVTNKFGPDSTTAKVQKVIDFANTPVLVWNDKFHRGGTGYIDGIKPEYMSDSVMWGMDPEDRPYVAIKMKVVSSNVEQTRNVGVETIFQRYSDTGSPWVKGSHFGLYPDVFGCVVYEDGLAKLSKLKNGEELSVERDYGYTNTKIKVVVKRADEQPTS